MNKQQVIQAVRRGKPRATYKLDSEGDMEIYLDRLLRLKLEFQYVGAQELNDITIQTAREYNHGSQRHPVMRRHWQNKYNSYHEYKFRQVTWPAAWDRRSLEIYVDACALYGELVDACRNVRGLMNALDTAGEIMSDVSGRATDDIRDHYCEIHARHEALEEARDSYIGEN